MLTLYDTVATERLSDVASKPMDEEWDCPEDHAYFAGPCTCPHDEEQHGWGACDVEDCLCEAGWEE